MAALTLDGNNFNTARTARSHSSGKYTAFKQKNDIMIFLDTCGINEKTMEKSEIYKQTNDFNTLRVNFSHHTVSAGLIEYSRSQFVL